MKRTGETLIAITLIVALCVALYLGVWWIRRDTVNRDASIRQDTYGRQNALVEQILDDIREADRPNVPANQRVAIVDVICDSAAKLTGSIELPINARTFIAQEC